jgi:hypothetical protein
MSSEKYEENSCGHRIDLVIILHELRVSYPPRNKFKAESVQVRPTHLTSNWKLLAL